MGEGRGPIISCMHSRLFPGGWDKVRVHMVELTFHRYSAQ